jgi:phenylacetate-CoA ligase
MEINARPPLPLVKTGIAEMVWPSVPGNNAAALLAQLFQLEQTQWFPRRDLVDRQLLQLRQLSAYAYRHSPFYRELFDQREIRVDELWSEEKLRNIPLLTRQALVDEAANIHCDVIPQSHGTWSTVQTSGSTGEVVEVRRTALNKLMWMALNLRDHFWHGRDFSRSAAFIRANVNAQDDDAIAQKEGWGAPVSLLFDSGPSYRQPLSLSVAEQAAWLLRRNPTYLLTYPTNLNALLDEFERKSKLPSALKEVRTIGETFSAALKARCENDFGLKTVDLYSAQEVGAIALQCPVSGLYHVQSESLIVEVLNDNGVPCKEGEVGRVVVTDLHGFATPIIRYEIRDYAETGEACSCGRGLPTLRRILGRRRNMVTLPDGSRHWPIVGHHAFREIAPIRQYQAVQHSIDTVEMKIVVDAPLTHEQEALLCTVIQEALGHPFTLRFSYYDAELPKTRGGKFEEFISMI